MNSKDKPAASKWNARYAWSGASLPSPAAILQNYGEQYLPTSGTALDLACGRGANALWLAHRHLDVSAWDISEVAIATLREQSSAYTIDCQVRDVVAEPPAPASYDVIVVSRFLDRSLCPAIAAALTNNGVLYYQTFTAGLNNKSYLLDNGELPTLFPTLAVLHYAEPAADAEGRAEAMLVAQNSATAGANP